jgi:GntR family transcriptional regulator
MGESRQMTARTALSELGGIDERSFAPAYVQLGQILEEGILTGRLRPGERIPSENDLGEAFGLSRMTVRRAISLLIDGGLLRSEQGRGTFVINPRTEGGLFFIPDFHEEMRAQGADSRVRLLGVKLVPAGKVPAAKLGIKRGKRVIYLERVLEGDGEPQVFDRKYMLYDHTQPLLEAELGHETVPEIFTQQPKFAPVRSDLTLSASVLDQREAKLLQGRAGDPAFCLEQLIYAAKDLKVIWGWLILRGDRFSFNSLKKTM